MTPDAARDDLVSGLPRLAGRLAALAGWRRYGLAFALGALTTLMLPPVNAFPIGMVTFPALLWLLGGAVRRRAAFAVGWWFGFGFFAIGLYWIGNALLVFAAKYALLLPFASAGLPAVLAIFIGLVTMVAWHGRTPFERVLLFAIGWIVAEWVRGHIATGFPWNLIGYAWTGSDAMLQSTAVMGIYGVSLLVIVSVSLPALLGAPAGGRVALAIAVALPVAVWAGGAARLALAPPVEFHPGVGLRIVQSDIPQREKWARQYRARNLKQFVDLSTANRPDWITHVIWPETAATFFVSENPVLRRALARVVPQSGLLITGGPRSERDPWRIMNSLYALDGAGSVVATFDKFHLVPFGEYVPLARYLPIEMLTGGKTGFTPGPGPRTLRLAGLPPVGPLICYEVIFPGNVTDPDDRPQWLLNLTNDAWYGVSAGPYQHLAQSRVRATEEGLPMVRAAYAGISTVIDPYGRILQRLGLNQSGFIDTKLPKPIAAPTIFVRAGDGILFGMIAVLMLVFSWARRKNNRQAVQ
jgi:apolipoprotein N-acyltransferase